MSSAVAFSGGLRRSFSKVMPNKYEKPSLSSLSLEILFKIFDLSAPRDLVQFCKTSSNHLNNVYAYLNSKCFVKKFHGILKLNSTTIQHNFAPSDLARLVRTCYQFNVNSAKKKQLCTSFLVQLYLKLNLLNCNSSNDYWGKLISEFTWDWSQWDFYELIKEFAIHTKLQTRVENFLCNNNGEQGEELALRRQLRSLFLDNYIPDTGIARNRYHGIHFRLSAILHFLVPEGALTHRLLLLLAAPISKSEDNDQQMIDGGEGEQQQPIVKEFIDYDRITAVPITDMESAQTFLGELPKFVELLLHTSTLEIDELRWSELEIFNFLEMLTTYPEPWVLRNFASLLIMEPALARVAVCIRAGHGDPIEAGNTLFSCVEACVILGSNAEMLLKKTLYTLISKCSIGVCLTVLRGAISSTHNTLMEILPTNDNDIIVPANVDEQDLKNALAANNQIAGLFLNNFHQIFA